MKKIIIDFQGGAHGNYLEFVCNKFLANVQCNESPFDSTGGSHDKVYQSEKVFHCGHFSFSSTGMARSFDGVIAIKIAIDDLLPLSAISLLRAGGYGYNNQFLEIDTYHKFNNDRYRWVLDKLIDSFFHSQIETSYKAIKDPSWPEVYTLDDFKSLPEWIQKECTDIHGFIPLELNENHPHCPRFVLREFFKIGFKDPSKAGFITQQTKMQYATSVKIFDFPFSCFYHKSQFIDQLTNLARFFGFEISNKKDLDTLHDTFLEKQIYKDHKQNTDTIFNRIIQGEIFDLDGIDLLQEAYLEAKLENLYGKESKVSQNKWFANSQEVMEYFNG